MNINAELLQKQWDSITCYESSFLRIDIQHPLEWYIGYLSINQKTFLLMSDAEIGGIDSSKSMAVNNGYRETDKKWTLTFQLLREEQQEVFMNFCCDILEYSKSAETSNEALDLVIKRYKQWNRLLESQRKGLMDEGSRKGLIGELIFLQQQITGDMDALTAVQGWAGPDGGDQDFVYSNGWHEIKTIGSASSTVSISSLEQLACTDNGELIILHIDKCTPDKKDAFSLNSIVQRTTYLIKNDLDALALFESKLNKYGYIDLADYAEQQYFHSGSQSYFVNNTFPKLTKENVPLEVVSGQYSLSIASLKNWKK